MVGLRVKILALSP